MKDSFQIKFIDCTQESLSHVGFDNIYIEKAIDKHIFKSIKIFGLSCAQANILKQTALSVGTDCAIHREVITGKVESSDCILSGSISHFHKIADKLKHQPFRLSALGRQICDLINNSLNPIVINGKEFDFNNNIYIMGILNVTPDSFSDGGQYNNIECALSHYSKLVENSVDIVDIGGESTRPYSTPVNVNEEINRVIPLIKEIRKFDTKTVISVDTRNSATAKLAIDSGANIINDVSALDWDKNMINVLREYSCPIILNHSNGTPDTMQQNINTNCDIVDEIYKYFTQKIELSQNNGIEKTRIILDPGLGFGKTSQQNFEIINRLKEFKTLGCPILVGHSRKNFIKEAIDSKDNTKLDIATTIISTKLIGNGANILRVHNTEEHKILRDLLKSFG